MSRILNRKVFGFAVILMLCFSSLTMLTNLDLLGFLQVDFSVTTKPLANHTNSIVAPEDSIRSSHSGEWFSEQRGQRGSQVSPSAQLADDAENETMRSNLTHLRRNPVPSLRSSINADAKSTAFKNEPLEAGAIPLSISEGSEAEPVMDSNEPIISQSSLHTFNTSADSNTISEILWEGVPTLNAWISAYWKGNKFCETLHERNASHTRPTLLNISVSCQELFDTGSVGTGNFVSAWYGIRLAARVLGDVDLQWHCTDAWETRRHLILPWITGTFSLSRSRSEILPNLDLPSEVDVCGNYETCPIVHMLPATQYDLRRMAIALVGVPSESHPSMAWAKEHLWNVDKESTNNEKNRLQLPPPRPDDPPLIPDVKLDDVVLHFRCGDLMNSNHPSFGFMKFRAFSKPIAPQARSIGIVTSPFDNDGQNRKGDVRVKTGERCRIVVTAFVDYLQQDFPSAHITIHNSPNETIALAFTRMIMANQTVAGMTSFGVFPVLASFGTGYIRKPDFKKAPNQWLLRPPVDQVADNVQLIHEPERLMAGTIRKMWQQPDGEERVLEWFRDNATIAA